MTLSQIVRTHFNEIADWRWEGKTWHEVEQRIRKKGFNPGAKSVSNSYYKELARRRSPKRVAAFKWANTNYENINDLLDQGYAWTQILALHPVREYSVKSPSLNALKAAFKTLDR